MGAYDDLGSSFSREDVAAIVARMAKTSDASDWHQFDAREAALREREAKVAQREAELDRREDAARRNGLFDLLSQLGAIETLVDEMTTTHAELSPQLTWRERAMQRLREDSSRQRPASSNAAIRRATKPTARSVVNPAKVSSDNGPKHGGTPMPKTPGPRIITGFACRAHERQHKGAQRPHFRC